MVCALTRVVHSLSRLLSDSSRRRGLQNNEDTLHIKHSQYGMYSLLFNALLQVSLLIMPTALYEDSALCTSSMSRRNALYANWAAGRPCSTDNIEKMLEAGTLDCKPRPPPPHRTLHTRRGAQAGLTSSNRQYYIHA